MLSQLRKLSFLLSRRDALHFSWLFLLMVVASCLEVASIGAVPAFVAALAVPEQLPDHPQIARILERLGGPGGKGLVIWGGVALLGVFVIKSAFLYVTYGVQARTSERYRVRLADRLFTAYLNAPYEFILARNSAELLRNVTAETVQILNGVLYPLLSAILSLMMTLFIVLFMVVAAPAISLVAVAVAGGGSWLFLRFFKSRLRALGQVAQRERREGIQAVNQGLGAFIDARICQREDYFSSVFRQSAERGAVANRMFQVLNRSMNPALETISVGAILLIMMFMSWRVTEPSALIPLVALVGAAIVRLKGTVNTAVSAITQVRFSMAAIDPVFEDLTRLEPSVRPKDRMDAGGAGGKRRLSFERAIVLDRVTYTYPGTTRPVLEGLDLSIPRGLSVAFVGSTGSGKSTLVNVLLGLLEPQRGRVTVDGVDIRTQVAPWHRNVGYIPQTIYLLDDTIRRNIAFGIADEEIDDGNLWTAIRAAQLEEFVQRLEDGASTVVGERGVRLSGGQRQRLGLARALYQNPEVLIMDEATSALDGYTEGLVMKALEGLKEERTLVMIAHRLSTVRNCDRIYFMEGGRIVDQGQYHELVESNSRFREMAQTA